MYVITCGIYVTVYDVCALRPCACMWCVSVCMYVIMCGIHVHVYGACTLCPCVVCVHVHVCGYVWYVCACRMHVLCVLVHVCVQMHACDCVCCVCAYGFCTLGASSQPLPGDKVLIEGLCPPAALQSCRGPLPGIFFKKSFLVVTVLLLGSDSLGPAGSPKNISWGCVSREGGSGMGCSGWAARGPIHLGRVS